MKTVVARQPILDRAKQIVGYELLYRSSDGSVQYDGLDGNMATAQVISNSVFSLGLDKLLGGRLGFINFTGEALVNGYAKFLPPESVVLEVLETTEPTPEVISACQELRRCGFKVALDDYIHRADLTPLLECADIVKIDIRQSGIPKPGQIVRNFDSRKLKALAEKVETWDEFNQARSAGYAYFQGYFFARPALVTGSLDLSLKRHHFQLLEALQAPELNYQRLEKIISSDVMLTYKLFRFINSALFGWSNPIDSIMQSLLLLGTDEFRRWATLILLCDMGQKKPHELLVMALVRARFCELLGIAAGMRDKAPSLFLMGMFSLLDALLDRSMEDALKEIPLESGVVDALLDRPDADARFISIKHLVGHHESGELCETLKHAGRLHVSETQLMDAYTASIEWAELSLGKPTPPAPKNDDKYSRTNRR